MRRQLRLKSLRIEATINGGKCDDDNEVSVCVRMLECVCEHVTVYVCVLVWLCVAVCVVSLLGSSTLLGRLCLGEHKKKVQQQLQLASSCPLDASLAAGKGGEQTELKLIAFIGSLPLLPSSFVRSMNLGNIISTFIENTYKIDWTKEREGRERGEWRECSLEFSHCLYGPLHTTTTPSTILSPPQVGKNKHKFLFEFLFRLEATSSRCHSLFKLRGPTAAWNDDVLKCHCPKHRGGSEGGRGESHPHSPAVLDKRDI